MLCQTACTHFPDTGWKQRPIVSIPVCDHPVFRRRYDGAYDNVQRFVRRCTAGHHGPKLAFGPLEFVTGDACQFDWNHEHVEFSGECKRSRWPISGLRTAVKCSPSPIRARPRRWRWRHVSGRFLLRRRARSAHLRQSEDCRRCHPHRQGAQVQSPLSALRNHYLFKPVACTPASGWETGQVENQVGNVREWLFTPLARFA